MNGVNVSFEVIVPSKSNSARFGKVLPFLGSIEERGQLLGDHASLDQKAIVAVD